MLNKQYVSQQQVQRRLITPDEAMRLPDDDVLIFVAGRPPIRAVKIRYYDDNVLSSRAALQPPCASDQFASRQPWYPTHVLKEAGPAA